MAKGNRTPHGSREERIANMERASSRVMTILKSINEICHEHARAYRSLPIEVREGMNNFLEIGEKSTIADNDYTLDDFYEYDYEDVMLGKMTDFLFDIIKTIEQSIYYIDDWKNNALKNGGLDPRENEDDNRTLQQINRSIQEYESVLQKASTSHGLFVARAKATDYLAPTDYDNEERKGAKYYSQEKLDEIKDIIIKYGGK